MLKNNILLVLMIPISILLTGTVQAQMTELQRVTDEMLLNPDPADWLMFSRTYDNQRFSPLDQINRQNVDQLQMAWSRGLHTGTQEMIPLVHQGVMYVAQPIAIVQALDATNGDLIWEYQRELPEDVNEYIRVDRTRTLAIRGDKIFYAAPDGYMVALGAENGELHWETMAHDYKSTTEYTTGPMVAGDKVITGRNCDPHPDGRKNCFIGAYHAETGEEVWRFHVAAGDGEPGSETWGNKPDGSRTCSPWGMPASYDPEHNLVYWGVANPSPHTRYKRHNGNAFAVPLTAPSELYCNSTLALDADTGRLAWYYQHIPGDDWDSDWTQERVLMTSRFDPDPALVKWFNPNVPRGQERDMVATVGEPGGLWVMDRGTGEFLWGIPFPAQDTPLFHISDVDVNTGQTSISRDTVLTGENQEHTLCFSNTKGYYPMAYHPWRERAVHPVSRCLLYKEECPADREWSFQKYLYSPRRGPECLDRDC